MPRFVGVAVCTACRHAFLRMKDYKPPCPECGSRMVVLGCAERMKDGTLDRSTVRTYRTFNGSVTGQN